MPIDHQAYGPLSLSTSGLLSQLLSLPACFEGFPYNSYVFILLLLFIIKYYYFTIINIFILLLRTDITDSRDAIAFGKKQIVQNM